MTHPTHLLRMAFIRLSRTERSMVLHGFPSPIHTYQPDSGPSPPFPVAVPPLLPSALKSGCTDPKVMLTFPVPFTVYVLSLTWYSLPHFLSFTLVFPVFPLYCCQGYGFFFGSESLRGLLLPPGWLCLPHAAQWHSRLHSGRAFLCLVTTCHCLTPHWAISPQA